MNVISVSNDTPEWYLPAVESWIHSMTVCLAYPWIAMVVASIPLTWNHTLAWFVASSWVCTCHRPGRAPQEPDDNAEDREAQGGERKYGERPGNPDPSLQRSGEEV